MPPELLTTDELAELLRTTPAGIHSLRYRGEGPPAVRVGRRLLFRAEDVQAWLAAQREEAPGAGGLSQNLHLVRRREGLRGAG